MVLCVNRLNFFLAFQTIPPAVPVVGIRQGSKIEHPMALAVLADPVLSTSRGRESAIPQAHLVPIRVSAVVHDRTGRNGLESDFQATL